MLQIILTTEHYEKKEGTKNAYRLTESTTEETTEQVYKNIVDSAKFFRRLGGSIYQLRTYTCAGYRVIEDRSTSPNRENKTIRKFKFIWKD